MAESNVRLRSGDTQADVLPGRGMLVSSFRAGGIEWLRLLEDIEASAATGQSIGIPLNHPWANRLSSTEFQFEDRPVALDARSPLIMRDWNNVVIHGVAWSRLAWTVEAQSAEAVRASLQWDGEDLLAVFPFRHRLDMEISVQHRAITVATTLDAVDGPVPVSFGFHPYVGLPGTPRSDWHLTTPPMRRFLLDERLLPTGRDEPFTWDAPLGDRHFDDGFALDAPTSTFKLSDGTHTLHVDLLEGFHFLQVYAPVDQDIISIEPMVAPANALVTGDSLPVATPGKPVRAVFRIRV
jgi:galactose mutarotase-like enzyme